MKRFSIYPGGVFLKRIRHLAAFSFIGITIFLGHIEDEVMKQAEHLSDTSIDAAQSKLVSVNDDLEKYRNFDILVPGQPLKAMKARVSEVDQTLEMVQESMKVFFSLTLLLGCIRHLYWISLVYPFFWLLCDWRLGNVKPFLKKSMIGLIVFNLASGAILWLMSEQIIAWLARLARG